VQRVVATGIASVAIQLLLIREFMARFQFLLLSVACMRLEEYILFLPQDRLKGDQCLFCGTRIPGVWGKAES
jgi:hypothetical protein